MTSEMPHPLAGLLDLYLTLPEEVYREWLERIDGFEYKRRNRLLETFEANKERRGAEQSKRIPSLPNNRPLDLRYSIIDLLHTYWKWRDGTNGGMTWRLLPPPKPGQTQFSYRAEHDLMLRPYVRQMLQIRLGNKPSWWVHVIELENDHWRDLMDKDLRRYDEEWADTVMLSWCHWVLAFSDYLYVNPPLEMHCADDAFVSMHNFLFLAGPKTGNRGVEESIIR